MDDNRQGHVYTAKLAEQAERYNDMAEAMKQVALLDSELNVEERNLLSFAYRNKVGLLRASFRILCSIQHKEQINNRQHRLHLVTSYSTTTKHEVESTCHEVIYLLEHHLIPNATNVEANVFYLKMKSDYYRYLAEVDDNRNVYAQKSRAAYDEAFDKGQRGLPLLSPVRLGLGLSFSVFNYEILNDAQKACEIAKRVFDETVSHLDGCSDDTYKDCTLILQLLRDNLTLWTSEDNAQEGNDVAENS